MAQQPKSAAAHEASDRPMTGPGFSGGAQTGPGAAGMQAQPQPVPGDRKSDPTRRTFQNQSVTVIRDATKADAGYDAGHPGQLIVKLPDGTERIANPNELSPAA